MDRASDSGSEGWGFESLPVYQKFQIPVRVSGIFYTLGGTRKDGRAKRGKKVSGGHFFSPWESPSASRRIRYGCGWKQNCFSHRLFGYLVFCFIWKNKNTNASLPAYHFPMESWTHGSIGF